MNKLIQAATIAATLVAIAASQTGCLSHNFFVARELAKEAEYWERGEVPPYRKTDWEIFAENWYWYVGEGFMWGGVGKMGYDTYRDSREDKAAPIYITNNDNRTLPVEATPVAE